MSDPVIELKGLKKDYGNGRGVFDVSFSVERGEVNGAGKTVTMRNLMGFIRPDEGTVSIDGLNCFSQRSRIQERLGYLPGEIACMDEMTGAAFLEFMARMKKLRDRTRMNQLVEYFELDPARRIRKMSKGTKQKVGLAGAPLCWQRSFTARNSSFWTSPPAASTPSCKAASSTSCLRRSVAAPLSCFHRTCSTRWSARATASHSSVRAGWPPSSA